MIKRKIHLKKYDSYKYIACAFIRINFACFVPCTKQEIITLIILIIISASFVSFLKINCQHIF